MADNDVIKSWCGIRRSYISFLDCKFQTSKGNGFCVSSPQTRTLKNKFAKRYATYESSFYLPSPDTSKEFKKRSSPALKVVTQSPVSRFIRLMYILFLLSATRWLWSCSP